MNKMRSARTAAVSANCLVSKAVNCIFSFCLTDLPCGSVRTEILSLED